MGRSPGPAVSDAVHRAQLHHSLALPQPWGMQSHGPNIPVHPFGTQLPFGGGLRVPHSPFVFVLPKPCEGSFVKSFQVPAAAAVSHHSFHLPSKGTTFNNALPPHHPKGCFCPLHRQQQLSSVLQPLPFPWNSTIPHSDPSNSPVHF